MSKNSPNGRRGIYILHFSRPLVIFRLREINSYGGSFHYVGLTQDMVRRIKRHRSKLGGCTKTRRARAQGITFSATMLDMEPNYENESHVTRNVFKYCRICQPS